jgi:hypothetical protein
MSNQFVDQFIEKKITVSVGEPWDFESKSGQNRLTGNIVHVVFDQESNPLLVCKVSTFLINKKNIDFVVAVNRYSTTQNLLENLGTGKPIGVNMFYFDEDVKYSDIIDAIRKNKHLGFLVGTISIEE